MLIVQYDFGSFTRGKYLMNRTIISEYLGDYPHNKSEIPAKYCEKPKLTVV